MENAKMRPLLIFRLLNVIASLILMVQPGDDHDRVYVGMYLILSNILYTVFQPESSFIVMLKILNTAYFLYSVFQSKSSFIMMVTAIFPEAACVYIYSESALLTAVVGGVIFFVEGYHIDRMLRNSTSEDSSTAASTPSAAVTCRICLESQSDLEKEGLNLLSTVCGHIFCSKCLPSYIKNKGLCPICRKVLRPKDFHQVFL